MTSTLYKYLYIPQQKSSRSQHLFLRIGATLVFRVFQPSQAPVSVASVPPWFQFLLSLGAEGTENEGFLRRTSHKATKIMKKSVLNMPLAGPPDYAAMSRFNSVKCQELPASCLYGIVAMTYSMFLCRHQISAAFRFRWTSSESILLGSFTSMTAFPPSAYSTRKSGVYRRWCFCPSIQGMVIP